MSRLFKEIAENNGRVALGLSTRSNIDYLNDINAMNVNIDKTKFEFEVRAIGDKDDTVTELEMFLDQRNVTIVDVLRFTYYINRSIKNGNLIVTAQLDKMVDCDGEVTEFGNCKPFEVLTIPFTEGAYVITNTGLAQLLFADFCSTKPDLYNTTTVSKIFIPTPIIVDYALDISDKGFLNYWFDKEKGSYHVCRTKVIGSSLCGIERTWWSSKCGLHVSLENNIINGIVMSTCVARHSNDPSLDINYITSREVVSNHYTMTLEIPILTEAEIEAGWHPLVDIARTAQCYTDDAVDLFVMANSSVCEIDLHICPTNMDEDIILSVSDRGFPIYRGIDPASYPNPLSRVSVVSVDYDWESVTHIYQEVSNIGIENIRIEPIINNGSMYYIYSEDMEGEPMLEEVLTIIKQPNPFERFL